MFTTYSFINKFKNELGILQKEILEIFLNKNILKFAPLSFFKDKFCLPEFHHPPKVEEPVSPKH